MTEWLYGHHAVEAVLKNGRRQILEVLITSKHQQRYTSLLQPYNAKIKTCEAKDLDKRFPESVHQGVAIKVSPLEQPMLEDVLENAQLLLVLDQITDPHNLGACLRNADAFGCDAVVTPSRNNASLTPVAMKAAVGAAETVPVVDAGNLNRALEKIKQAGFWVVGLDGHTNQELKDINMKGKIALVMGSEGDGLRDLVKKNCDFLAKIPMVGTVESLNVSVSAGIALYETLRQQQE